MANIRDLTITDLADAAITVNRFQVSCRVTEGLTDALIADLTGANAVVFPAALGTLTVKQRRSLLRSVIRRLIMMRAGLDDGTESEF